MIFYSASYFHLFFKKPAIILIPCKDLFSQLRIFFGAKTKMKSKKPVAASPASAERLNVWSSIKCHMPSHYSLFWKCRGIYGAHIQQTIFRQQRMSYKCFSFFSLFLLGGKLVQREEVAFVESLFFYDLLILWFMARPSHSVFRLLAYLYIYFIFIPSWSLYAHT